MRSARYFLALVALVSACTQAQFEQFVAELAHTEAVEIVFFDVGQGDAILVRLPDGATLLVDAGRGSRIVEILQEHGVESILRCLPAGARYKGGVRPRYLARPC